MCMCGKQMTKKLKISGLMDLCLLCVLLFEQHVFPLLRGMTVAAVSALLALSRSLCTPVCSQFRLIFTDLREAH